jgi:hypothetical protein
MRNRTKIPVFERSNTLRAPQHAVTVVIIAVEIYVNVDTYGRKILIY